MSRLNWVLRWVWRIARYPMYLNQRYNPFMTGVARRALQSLGSIPAEDIARMTGAEVRKIYAYNPLDERYLDNPMPLTPETKEMAKRLSEQVRKRLEKERQKDKEGGESS